VNELLLNIRNAVERDPKKTAVLGALVLVLGGLWVKMLVGAGPRSTSAAPAPLVATPVTGPSSPGDVIRPGAAAARVTQAEAVRAKWGALPAAPGRNLFAVRSEFFPRVGPNGPDAGEPAKGGGESQLFWARLGKSMAARADEAKRQGILTENLRQEAARLKLQTILKGNVPTAMIDGRMVREGDVIASFRVVKIEARRVIIEREGIGFVIAMQQ
jgi:hypothetical protein